MWGVWGHSGGLQVKCRGGGPGPNFRQPPANPTGSPGVPKFPSQGKGVPGYNPGSGIIIPGRADIDSANGRPQAPGRGGSNQPMIPATAPQLPPEGADDFYQPWRKPAEAAVAPVVPVANFAQMNEDELLTYLSRTSPLPPLPASPPIAFNRLFCDSAGAPSVGGEVGSTALRRHAGRCGLTRARTQATPPISRRESASGRLVYVRSRARTCPRSRLVAAHFAGFVAEIGF